MNVRTLLVCGIILFIIISVICKFYLNYYYCTSYRRCHCNCLSLMSFTDITGNCITQTVIHSLNDTEVTP